jgi:predicted PurR-regulated permease PerM
VLIAIFLRGLSDFVSERTGLSHGLSLAIVLFVLIGLLVALFAISAPRLANELGQFADRLPQAVENLRKKIESTQIGRLLLSESPRFDALMRGRGGDLLGSVTGVVSSTFGAIVSLVVVLFVGMYLAAAPRFYVKGVIHLIPPARRERMAEVLGAVGYTLKWWMIGQAIDMVVIGIATAIGLWLLGVPLALLLGLIAALFNFIPNFGPLFALIPAVMLTLPDDPSKAVYVVILFLVLQNIEGYLLMPAIQRRAVDLPAAVTIVAQVLMGILAGGLGLALAAPLAAAVMVAVKMLYVEDTLGDVVKTPADGDARDEVKEVKKATREVARQHR